MPEWTVTKVSGEPRDWKTQKGGEFTSYRCDLEPKGGGEKVEFAEVVRKRGGKAPVVGDVIEGEVEDREYESGGEKKKDKRFRPAGGGGGGGGGRAWKPRPDDSPVVYASRQAGIIRQHSQNMALRVLELAQASGDDFAVVMDRLGITMESEAGGEAHSIALVDAFALDVSRAAGGAWEREAERGNIASALAEIG